MNQQTEVDLLYTAALASPTGSMKMESTVVSPEVVTADMSRTSYIVHDRTNKVPSQAPYTCLHEQ